MSVKNRAPKLRYYGPGKADKGFVEKIEAAFKAAGGGPLSQSDSDKSKDEQEASKKAKAEKDAAAKRDLDKRDASSDDEEDAKEKAYAKLLRKKEESMTKLIHRIEESKLKPMVRHGNSIHGDFVVDIESMNRELSDIGAEIGKRIVL